jgi:hypothetical protein
MAWTEKLLQGLLSVTCLCIFLYKAEECLGQYLRHETVSKQSQAAQQAHPLPSVCITSRPWAKARLEGVGLTIKQFTERGVWTTGNMTAEQVYEFASPMFEDLVKKIVVRVSMRNTDRFKEVSIYANKDADYMKKKGLVIKRSDYYYYLKVFCMEFSYEFGLQSIKIVPQNKTSIVLSVITPGNFFAYDRRRNEIFTNAAFRYTYQVYHSVSEALPLFGSCTHAMDWAEDGCRLNNIHQVVSKGRNCTVPWLLSHTRYNSRGSPSPT